jgi:hypothetical protein
MNSNGNFEERLATLEREVAELKRQIQTPSRHWLDEVAGSMRSIPQEEFDKFVRYGEEFRRAQASSSD